MASYKTFVVPYDFSEYANAAVRVAADLAKQMGGKLHLVHVIPQPLYAYPHITEAPSVIPMHPNLREDTTKSLQLAIDEFDLDVDLEAHVYEALNIAEQVNKSAETLGADMIVMGTHGRTGLAHAFLGSVAERTMRSAPCPVLTVRG